jgi:putative FmdB family regulatory protein
MPTYDYRCQACGHTIERFQSITAPSVRKCPVCGLLKVKRLIGAGAGVIFKGSGFYQTDYRSESYRKGAEKEKPPSAGSSTGDTGSKAKGSDSKGSDSKGADPKGSDSKGSDSKGSDSKGSDSKGASSTPGKDRKS